MSSPAHGPSSGKIRILSANTRGFSEKKADKIKSMMENNQIDLVVLQECNGKVAFEQFKGFSIMSSPEAPYCDDVVFPKDPSKNYQDEHRFKVPKDLAGGAKDYVVIARAGSSMKVEPIDFQPEKSQKVKDYLTDNKPGSGTASRGSTPPVDDSKLKALGLRPPQLMSISVPGFQSITLLNYHAPQSGGTTNGYSGMGAKLGHEIVQRVVGELSGDKILIGDQNAHHSSLRLGYPSADIVSATGDDLVHAVASKGLKATEIKLGSEGKAFQNKASEECSDHAPLAVEISLTASLA